MFSNQKIADSPYLKIYENFKRKIIHKFVSKDEKGKINSQENRSKMQKSKDINVYFYFLLDSNNQTNMPNLH